MKDRETARARLLAAIDAAEASLARGEGRVITRQSMRKLASEIKQRGRARLAAEKSPASCRQYLDLRDGTWRELSDQGRTTRIRHSL